LSRQEWCEDARDASDLAWSKRRFQAKQQHSKHTGGPPPAAIDVVRPDLHRRSMQRIVFSVVLTSLAACGDSTGATATDDAGGTQTGTTADATPTSSADISGSASMSDGTTAGSVSESAEGSSTSGTPTTSATTGDSTTTGDSATTGDSTTTSETSETSGTTAAPFVCAPVPAPAGPIAIDPACEGQPIKEVMDPWNINIEWFYDTAGNGAAVMPAIGPLIDENGDGEVDDADVPVIAFNTYVLNNLTVLHGDGSGVAFTLPGMNGLAGPAIADVDSDGAPEVITITNQNRVVAVDGAGVIKWTSPALPGLDSYPQVTVSDLDQDGDVEVIADTAILDGATGALVATLPSNAMFSTPVVADLDLDGAKEIVLHNTVYSSSGAPLWSLMGAGSEAFAAVADIDDDPEGELLVAWGANLHVHEHDGAEIGKYPVAGGGLAGPPCMADFDGDGAVEIVVPHSTLLHMMETDGSSVWQSPIDDSSGAAGCSAYDVNGDGTFEVLFADQENLRIYNGATGEVLYVNAEHTSGTLWEYPVVADVDLDGSAEIIVASNTHGLQPLQRLTVFGHGGDGWSAAGRSWAVHDYGVTNVNPDGSVPTAPEPSWATHNLFRARPTVDDSLLPPPDLLVNITDTCVDCSASAHVVYQVCNQGGGDVAAGAPLTLFALANTVEVVVESRLLPAIAAGTCDVGDSFVFDPALVVDGGVIVRLYDDGNGTTPAVECNLANDQAATDLTGC
jgi:hypothetical protein